MNCLFESNAQEKQFAHVEFRDDCRYEFVCEKNHKTITIVQEEKYEILFEIGINAIIDGYYREAISSFASSLERFYEFTIGVLIEKAGIEREQLKSSWKSVASSSERQLGAFIFLWLINFRNQPNVLSSDDVKFRNEVIHKGKIPNRMEAIKFGNTLIGIMFPLLQKMKIEINDSLLKANFHTMSERRNPEELDPQGVMTICNIFRMTSDNTFNWQSIEEYLSVVEKFRKTDEKRDI